MPASDLFHIDHIAPRFQPAVLRVQQLQTMDRYHGAFLFGSVARGDASAASDLDVRVLVDDENTCAALNHPTIAGVKLDLTFLSLRQLADDTQREIERGLRVPMVAESLVVFDKSGALTRLRESAGTARPRPCSDAEQRTIQYAIFHANDKAERLLTTDPSGALLVMHTSFFELVKTHYRTQNRWQVSDKRVLADLRDWGPALAALVERFVSTTDAWAKFGIWTEIIDYVMAPLGGRKTPSETNCPCDGCLRDLEMLMRHRT